MTRIVIIGSISMDLVMETSRIAEEGETVFGDRFSMVPGGKGANQAVAVGRLSDSRDQIAMIGCLGQDSFAPILKQNLQDNHLSVECVGTVPSSCGIAQITLYHQDNRIIYCPGANGLVDPNQWQAEWDLLTESDLVILQNEIPHNANLAIAKFCHDHGVKVLYNPAPSRETDLEIISIVDFMTPNHHECMELFPARSLEDILHDYPNKLIVTLGKEGAMYFDGEEVQHISAIIADAVDTTGAGDTFNGAFGFALAKGLEIKEAIRFATLASHISVQKFGAQGGMPTLEEMKGHEKYEENWNFK